MNAKRSVDPIFLTISLVLIGFGFLVFVSAAFGMWAKSEVKFANILLSQIVFGLGLGGLSAWYMSRINLQYLSKYAFWIFIATVVLSLLVFVPGIGMEHGGAKRWLDLGITTFQPGEVLKIGVIIYLAAWLTLYKKRLHEPLFGIGPLLAVLGIACFVFIMQRDTGSFLVAACGGVAMYIVAGARWRDIGIIVVLACIGLALLAMWRPYVLDRFTTLWKPDDAQGSGYQIRQSLIAIGSGEISGRGFGQSIQKFNYLPEAHGDSIYAVLSEEFGFFGSVFLILLYSLFGLRGLWISAHTPDTFSAYLCVGLVMILVSQSFINMGSMLGIAPLTGVPLVFVSHGGTALLFALIQVGIIMNISRKSRAL
jgi:cell division protein FtsW